MKIGGITPTHDYFIEKSIRIKRCTDEFRDVNR